MSMKERQIWINFLGLIRQYKAIEKKLLDIKDKYARDLISNKKLKETIKKYAIKPKKRNKKSKK